MNFWALSGLVNGIASSIFGLFVYLKDPRSPSNKAWSFFSLTIAVWGYSYFFWQVSADKLYALFWCRSLMVSAIFIPVTFLHFLLVWLDLYHSKKSILVISYTVSFINLIFNFTPYFIKDVAPALWFRFWPQAGILFLPFLIFWIVLVLYCWYILLHSIRTPFPMKRNQIKYVLLGAVIGFSGGFTNYPLWYGIKVPPYGNVLVSVYVGLMAYAIVKHHLMDINIALTRAGIFAFVYTFVLGLPLFLGYRYHIWLPATYLAIVLASIGPYIYNRLRQRVEEKLLAEQKRYQRTLVQAAQGMVKVKELKKLVKLITYIITKAVRVKRVGLFLYNKEKLKYELVSSRNMADKEMSIGEGDSLIRQIKQAGGPLLEEDIGRVVKNQRGKEEVKEFYKREGVQLIVPALNERGLSGFLCLGPKPENKVFTSDDINVFRILANQASMAIDNCRFLEEFKRAEEKVFRADKLATVGTMAEGVSHQLNNRLQVFAAVAGDLIDVVESIRKREEARSLKKEIDYLSYGLEKIEKNVMHSAQIIRGILSYARTEKDRDFRYIDIKEVIKIAVDLLGVKHSVKDFRPEVKVKGEITPVWGSLAELSEAVFNLIDNAYEAIEDKKTRLRVKEDSTEIEKRIDIELEQRGEKLRMKVEDNGIGIKEENHPKIFAPFYTTKSSAKSGTGLGMYVLRRIIEENHKGKIWFESEYMKGASFYVELSCKKM